MQPLIIGVLAILGLYIAFLAADQWFYRKAIRQYQGLSDEQKREVGLYAPFTIAIFSTLGRRPSRDELGITFRESLHMGPGYVIPCYSFVEEFNP